ncbi:hypothetical protein HUU05_04490 [candidate division KSB1 bacterium]|nr:hypothetical protein [candidate division KSB1 bacterium]
MPECIFAENFAFRLKTIDLYMRSEYGASRLADLAILEANGYEMMEAAVDFGARFGEKGKLSPAGERNWLNVNTVSKGRHSFTKIDDALADAADQCAELRFKAFFRRMDVSSRFKRDREESALPCC